MQYSEGRGQWKRGGYSPVGAERGSPPQWGLLVAPSPLRHGLTLSYILPQHSPHPRNRAMTAYSASPSGEQFPIPIRGRLRQGDGAFAAAGRPGPARGQGSGGGDGRRLRRRGDGGHHRRHGRPEDRQAQQVRHRLPAAQPAQLLEDPHAQPGRVAGEGRRPRGRSDDCPLRQRKEDAHGHLQQRLPGAGRLRGGRRAVRLHEARPGQHAQRRGGDDRVGGHHADHRRARSSPIA